MASMFQLIGARSLIDDESPPPLRTRDEDIPTLLVSWWCTIFAFVIILTRVIGRYIRTERLFTEDKIMAFSIIPLMIRMGLVHVVLLYGTNNTHVASLTPQQIRQREMGSRLVLGSRIFYAMYIWTAKVTVSEFLKRITENSWNQKSEIVLKVIRWFLVVTFIGVIIGTLAECQPFDHYWQVVPDPGPKCRNGYAQLLTMGTSDVITDLLLVFFPMPVIIKSSMPAVRKIWLCLLFSLSFILLAIAAYRMPAIIAVHGQQQRRSLWASIEILAAAMVANSVIIGSFVRDRGIKKGKFKNDSIHRTNSADHPSINRTLTKQHWGDDEDEELFRSLGCRLNSVAESTARQPVPRAPEVVEPVRKNSSTPSKGDRPLDAQDRPNFSTPNYQSRSKDAPNFDEEAQEMTFLDVGGILRTDSKGDQDLRRTVSPDESIVAQDWANNHRPETSIRTSDDSSAALTPVAQATAGAQESPSPNTPQYRRPSAARSRHAETLTTSNGRPAEANSPLELNDAGGLLS